MTDVFLQVDETDPRVSLLLKLADDELVLGHRLSEWTGWVPYLEADLALSSIAQDEIGHARALYGLAVSLGAATDEDVLALGRSPGAYRNAVLCATRNGDFARSLARQWLYDRADRIRLDGLRAGSWGQLVELLNVIELEEAFHRAHGDAWFERLANGPLSARHRFAEAITEHLPLLGGLFEPLPSEEALLDAGIMTTTSAEQLEALRGEIAPHLDSLGISDIHPGTHAEMVPTAAGAVEVEADPSDGEDADAVFRELWTEMTALYREHAGASW